MMYRYVQSMHMHSHHTSPHFYAYLVYDLPDWNNANVGYVSRLTSSNGLNDEGEKSSPRPEELSVRYIPYASLVYQSPKRLYNAVIHIIHFFTRHLYLSAAGVARNTSTASGTTPTWSRSVRSSTQLAAQHPGTSQPRPRSCILS